MVIEAAHIEPFFETMSDSGKSFDAAAPAPSQDGTLEKPSDDAKLTNTQAIFMLFSCAMGGGVLYLPRVL